jgi:hypothetical protein
MPENLIRYNHIPVQKSTFKAGLASHVHRWFRLTPSFGPDLVREMISELQCKKDEVILDPFSGASTTLIESRLEGYDCYGFEINPFLYWVGKASINWDVDVEVLKRNKLDIIHQFNEQKKYINFDNLSEFNLHIPPIHNPLRWWRKDVITELLILKRAIHERSSNEHIKDFFLLCLAGVLVPDLTNVTLGKLQLHFIVRDDHDIKVLPTFLNHLEGMTEDLSNIKALSLNSESKIFHTNSVTLEGVSGVKPISCVITSPPYPNRYSYVWNTRPHLYFLDFFTSPKEASALDKETIGGTWGTATSILGKGKIDPAFEALKGKAWKVVESIRAEDNLMANYVMKYFNLLAEQIKAMDSLPQKNLRCAYVVGNSRIKNCYIETDVILGEIFEGLGYRLKSIDRIRKRNSGKDLYESIVYSEKL